MQDFLFLMSDIKVNEGIYLGFVDGLATACLKMLYTY